MAYNYDNGIDQQIELTYGMHHDGCFINTNLLPSVIQLSGLLQSTLEAVRFIISFNIIYFRASIRYRLLFDFLSRRLENFWIVNIR